MSAGVPVVRRSARRTQARRPGRPVRARIASRLPTPARAAAACAGVAFVSLLGYLLAGPLMRVEHVEWHGQRFTADTTLHARLGHLPGSALLLVDTGALEEELAALPGVAAARVSATLPSSISVTIDEDEPQIIWQTSRGRLLATGDGAVIGSFAPDGELPGDLAGLPVVDDRRTAASSLSVGGRLPRDEVAAAARLASLDPAVLGSVVPSVSVRIDDQYGFSLVAPQPGWTAALGFYGREPGDDAVAVAARLERQVAALRTAFATQPEATVMWVDARNPGKVYFRASED